MQFVGKNNVNKLDNPGKENIRFQGNAFKTFVIG